MPSSELHWKNFNITRFALICSQKHKTLCGPKLRFEKVFSVAIMYSHISSVESQKGTINIQRCPVENQKGTIAVQSLYGDSALLALNWQFMPTTFVLLLNNCLVKNIVVDSRYNKLLGPSEITLLYWFFFLYILVAKTVKYKEILNFGTRKITLLYRDFVISVFFTMRVHCIGMSS